MPALPDPNRLGNILLFQGLTPAELTKMNDVLRCSMFPTGRNIITMEQPGEVAYVILEGTVKIHIDTADGSEVILAILGAGEIVGELSVVDSLTRSANVVTMEESAICWIDRPTLWDCIRVIPQINHNLVRILSRRLRLANAQIQSLATLDVYGRVARQILAFAKEYGEQTAGGDTIIPLRLTQTDLAGLIGATRVRVNQVLVDYKHHNYISVDTNHRITVHDQVALSRRCV